MASVKRFPGTRNWSACYKIPTGRVDAGGRPVYKRVQRSTGIDDEARALQVAITYERAAELAAQKQWTADSARRFLAELHAVSGVQIGEIEPCGAYLRRWLTTQQRQVSAKSFQNYSGIVSGFLAFLGPRGKFPVADVTPRVVSEFRDAELAAGKGGTTVNKALSILAQAFEEAVASHLMEKNPARGIRVKGADKKAQKRDAFTFDQFSAIVRANAPSAPSRLGRHVHADWQTFVLATGYTGARQQETAQLDWSRVDFKSHLLGFVRSKNGDTHFMPMHPALERHLRALWIDAGRPARGLMMPHLATLSGRKLSRHFRETILPRAGISQPYAAPSAAKGVGRVLAKFSIHSLRHSLSTWLNAAGVPELMRNRLIGWEDEDVARNYTHTELAQARAELAKIPVLRLR